MSNSKRGREGLDRISDLPVELICHILSYVSTKCAVKTTILSKRWKDIWRLVPVLDFTEMPRDQSLTTKQISFYKTNHEIFCSNLTPQQRELYVKFVNSVLAHHDNEITLRQLRFEIYEKYDDNLCWQDWITAIMSRQIEKIDLSSSSSTRVPLHRLPFPTHKLLVLKLKGNITYDFPESLRMPILGTLHLHSIKFLDMNPIPKLLKGCPALKELVLDKCLGTYKIVVHSLTLETLKIRGFSWRDILLPEIIQYCVVNTPNLKHFDLWGVVTHCDIGNSSLLSKANIDIIIPHSEHVTIDRSSVGTKLLRSISGVQTLRFRVGDKIIVDIDQLLPFPNLTRLETSVDDYMLQILKRAPNLVSLVLVNDFPWIESVLSSQTFLRFLSSLASIEIENFRNSERCMDAVEYILKNASVLKELKLHMGATENRKRRAYKILLTFPRASPSCKVLTYSYPHILSSKR